MEMRKDRPPPGETKRLGEDSANLDRIRVSNCIGENNLISAGRQQTFKDIKDPAFRHRSLNGTAKLVAMPPTTSAGRFFSQRSCVIRLKSSSDSRVLRRTLAWLCASLADNT